MGDFMQRLDSLTDQDREDIRRMLSGQADNDLIRRGDVLEAIRSLRTDPVPPSDFQRALGEVARRVVRCERQRMTARISAWVMGGE